MNLYYKATRPDGKNSWDGSIDYRGNIGKRIVCPGWRGKEAASLCSETVLHASADPLDSISYSRIPCALFEVWGRPMVRGDV